MLLYTLRQETWPTTQKELEGRGVSVGLLTKSLTLRGVHTPHLVTVSCSEDEVCMYAFRGSEKHLAPALLNDGVADANCGH